MVVFSYISSGKLCYRSLNIGHLIEKFSNAKKYSSLLK
ncbi:MAG: hypothetical protein ACI85X_000842, partial [Woeseiaceae bacterium]